MINIHDLLPGLKPFVLGWIEDAAASASSIRLGSYVRTNEADLITARHTFDPPAGNSPFILSANGQGQLVTGLNADLLDGLHASELSSSGHGHGTGSANTLTYWSSSSLLGYIANGSGFLKNNGAGAFTWENTPAAGHNLLSSTHSDSLTASVYRGDVLYGNSTPAWARLAHPGAASHFLISSAADVAWSTYTLGLGGNLTTPAAGAAALMDYANSGNFGVGVTPTESIQVTGNIRLPTTTATVGIIKFGTIPFIHQYGGVNDFFAGGYAGNLTYTGTHNTGVGFGALAGMTDSYGNTGIGSNAGSSITTGSYNVLMGYSAGRDLTQGSNNTIIGYAAGLLGQLHNGCVMIGTSGGAWETGDNKLFIDNAARASEADARLKALIYGIFDAAVANQSLTFNAGSMGFFGTAAAAQSTGWSVNAGYTADKAFDPESTTQLEIGRVLGTLIDALKTYGLLGA